VHFISFTISNNDKLDWVQFTINLKEPISCGIGFLLLLSILNRFFEILKWQNLASNIKPITVSEATKQVLAALTAGIFTPNGIGEYAGKALYYEKSETTQVIFLNLICNGIKWFSVIIGLFGLLYFNLNTM
jgi:hypothetical protein